MSWLIAILLLVVWAALYLSRFQSHDIEGWRLIQVIKKQESECRAKVESEEVLAEREACARIAEMLERDEKMPDSMKSVAARIRILIQSRGVR